MATRFESMFARTGAANLARQFGESITYYNRAGDAGRVVQAIVERGTMEIISATGDIAGYAMIVRVANDATTGISSSEIDTGGDEIGVPLRVGDAAKRRAIVRVLNDNAGMVRFVVQ